MIPGIDQFTIHIRTALKIDLEDISGNSPGSQESRPLRSTTASDKLDSLIITTSTGYL